MSKTISQLEVGTPIYVEENGTPTEYVLVSKDEYGCILLRGLAVITKRMNATNVSVYEGCEMDAWLQDEEAGFMSRFDNNTKMAIVSRSRPTFTYGDTECHYISRKCFLLTYGEVFGSSNKALEPLDPILAALMKWKRSSDLNSSRVTKGDNNPSSVGWWLASAYSSSAFCCVSGNGSSVSNNASSGNYWTRPALNVAPATIVSEFADKIYLVAPATTTKPISYHGLIRRTNSRPKKALVKVDTSNLHNIAVQLCNNYGDTEPNWVNAQIGQETTFTNTERETVDWQIGIKFYGESHDLEEGYTDEPIILAEVD